MKKPNRSPWYLELGHVASGCTPDEAADWLQHHATQLGICCHGEINQDKYLAFPGDAKPHCYYREPRYVPPKEAPSEQR